MVGILDGELVDAATHSPPTGNPSATLDAPEAAPDVATVESTSTHAITFLDVLGWKGVYLREKSPIRGLKSVVQSMVREAEHLTRGRTGLETKILSISDTIVIATNLGSQAPAEMLAESLNVHAKLARIALNDGLKSGLPMRGATSLGDALLSVDGSTFVGRAIDEAAAWHETADWFGLFLAPSALFAVSAALLAEHWREYEPPLKSKVKFKTCCVKWIENEAELRGSFARMSPILPDNVVKYMNTLEFGVAKPSEDGAVQQVVATPQPAAEAAAQQAVAADVAGSGLS